MPTVPDAFAEILVAERRWAGLSQEELGLRSGLDRRRSAPWSAPPPHPSWESVIRIAGALDKDPAELLPAVRWHPPTGAPTPSGEFVEG